MCVCVIYLHRLDRALSCCGCCLISGGDQQEVWGSTSPNPFLSRCTLDIYSTGSHLFKNFIMFYHSICKLVIKVWVSIQIIFRDLLWRCVILLITLSCIKRLNNGVCAYMVFFVAVGDVRVREVQSRWMAPSTGPVAACYPQQQVIKPPVHLPVSTSEWWCCLWTNHTKIWFVFYLPSVKLKSNFLLNFEDRLSTKP